MKWSLTAPSMVVYNNKSTKVKMVETLNTFFMCHPFKKLNSLQHVCKYLNLPITGTAETLRNRIVKHVEDGKAADEEVREMALEFKMNEQRKKNKDRQRENPSIATSGIKRTVNPMCGCATSRRSKRPQHARLPALIFSRKGQKCQ